MNLYVNVHQTVKVILINNVLNLNVSKIVIARLRRPVLTTNVRTHVVYLVPAAKMQTVFQEIISGTVHAHLVIREILFLVVFLFNTAQTTIGVHQEQSVLTIYVLVSFLYFCFLFRNIKLIIGLNIINNCIISRYVSKFKRLLK